MDLAPASLTVRLFGQVDLPEPERISLAQGAATVLTRRAPDREGPNQDAVLAVGLGPQAGVLAVADGAGGMPNGDAASNAALEAFAAALREAEPSDAAALQGAVLDGFDRANRAVLDLKLGAMTTLAVAAVWDGVARTYHVGDSMVLIVGQRGAVRAQTVSHSPVGYGLEAGLIDESEAVNHDERHLVLNLLGSADMRIEIGPEVALKARDTVVLMSDGVTDNFFLKELIEHVRKGDPRAGLRELASVARARMTAPTDGVPSHMDDLSVIAFRLARRSKA